MQKASAGVSRGVAANARHPELARYLLQHAIIFGSFTLSSGRKSDYYCDGKQVSFSGEGLALIVDAILHEIGELEVDAIGGMDMGATPIVSAVALRSFQLGKPISSFVVRKDVKAHGTKKEIEGTPPSTPGRIVIIDDVVTSGQSIVKSVEAVQRSGHQVVLALSVLDRQGSGAEALKGMGIRYQPLVTVAELGIADQPQ
jgi:orotate phosphoribosyltransferase